MRGSIACGALWCLLAVTMAPTVKGDANSQTWISNQSSRPIRATTSYPEGGTSQFVDRQILPKSHDHDTYTYGEDIQIEIWIDTQCDADLVTGPCGTGISCTFTLPAESCIVTEDTYYGAGIGAPSNPGVKRVDSVEVWYSKANQNGGGSVDAPDESQGLLCTLETSDGWFDNSGSNNGVSNPDPRQPAVGGTVNGDGCPPALVPQVGSFIASDATGQNAQLCTATLVDANWVLTSAHCLFSSQQKRLDHFVVYMGLASPRPCYTEKNWGMVSSCQFPSSYDPTDTSSPDDYAVCKLHQPSGITALPAVGGSAGRVSGGQFTNTGIVGYPGGDLGSAEPWGWVPYFEACNTYYHGDEGNDQGLNVRAADRQDPTNPCSFSSGMSGGPLFATANDGDKWALSSLYGQDRFVIGVIRGYDGTADVQTAIELEAAEGSAAAENINGWIA